jgi:hypothetical protein
MLGGKGSFLFVTTLRLIGLSILTCCSFHNEQERIIVLVYLYKITSVYNVEISVVVFTFNTHLECNRR